VKISVDDFGTGYSSLSYLGRYPLDELKIDQSFIQGIGRGDREDAIVTTIIDLAHNLGLKAVAEGVETEAQEAFLMRHDCDLAQGYLLARPMPIDDLCKWLQRTGTPPG